MLTPATPPLTDLLSHSPAHSPTRLTCWPRFWRLAPLEWACSICCRPRCLQPRALLPAGGLAGFGGAGAFAWPSTAGAAGGSSLPAQVLLGPTLQAQLQAPAGQLASCPAPPLPSMLLPASAPPSPALPSSPWRVGRPHHHALQRRQGAPHAACRPSLPGRMAPDWSVLPKSTTNKAPQARLGLVASLAGACVSALN